MRIYPNPNPNLEPNSKLNLNPGPVKLNLNLGPVKLNLNPGPVKLNLNPDPVGPSDGPEQNAAHAIHRCHW